MSVNEPDRIADQVAMCRNTDTRYPGAIEDIERLLERLAAVERERDEFVKSHNEAERRFVAAHEDWVKSESELDYALNRIAQAESALLTLQRQVREWKPFPIQGVGMIPWTVAERAYARYSQLYGKSQSLERLAERGGFGLAELGFLLRGYEKRQDSQEDDGDWKRACEFATKAILAALLPSLAERENA